MITAGVKIKNYCIITIYKSPKFTFASFKSNITKMCKAIEKENTPHIIVIGDFNINILSADSNSTTSLLQFMESKNLYLIMNNNTITTDNNTIIDLCFSNNKYKEINIFESIYSDHKPLWFQVEC